MIKVIIPIVLLLAIVLIRKIPVIGGKINVALLVGGAAAMVLGGIYSPPVWIEAFVSGVNKLSWIIALSIVGSIFAEISYRLGTVDLIIGIFNEKFGKHPRALVVSIMFALVLAGSLLGDAIAAAAVIGSLTIGLLASMNIKYEKISAIIVMGACIGSIMPPMSQGLALAATLVGTDADPVLNVGYLTIACIFILVSVYVSFFLIKKENVPGANSSIEVVQVGESAKDIFVKNWKSLIPMVVLILIILLRTLPIPYVAVDLGPEILKHIQMGVNSESKAISLFDILSNISVFSGMTNGIVLSIICAIGIAFFFPVIRKNGKSIIRESFLKVKETVGLQICCGFMLGCFYTAGTIDAVTEFALGLNNNVLIIGAGIAMVLIGMLTGSQSTAQNVVFSFFGPALVATGVEPVFAAIAGAHLASAGQGLPPADLTTFVVAGFISAQFGVKVNPIKSMLYSMPMCILLGVVGFLFCYL